MAEPGFTHLDEHGAPRMVDVADKPVTRRIAVATGSLIMSMDTLRAITGGSMPKGNVLVISQIAGISAAKRTSDLIPLCHPLPLTSVDIEFQADETLPGIRARATARTDGKTGVEMEALTAVTVALLTAYDMCKAMDREMSLEGVRLLRKEGGRSGPWEASQGES
jgi:cyclic pyranopterin monophosphate synthase